MTKPSPINSFIEKRGMLMLDGGLATELEKRGYRLDGDLWSARILKEDPEAIRSVHYDYLRAGADCITTASYQATVEGFMNAGISKVEALSLISLSVSLAEEARDRFLKSDDYDSATRLRPIIAGSIGPYGAMLADGSEYKGDYGVSDDDLMSFHEPRWEILSNSSVDLLAIETIPSYQEAEVLLNLLNQSPETVAWISFSCRDGERINDGTTIKKCASLFENCDQVIAIGVNCTAPKYISSLIRQVQLGAPGKQVIVYPNSGEVYDAEEQRWKGSSEVVKNGFATARWYEEGAKLIGGCCRIEPKHIHEMYESFIRR
ncbi:MAG: homocysteine S-methyltransferase [Candidatus Marinimicrobia bacterium]|nr:homocysteine S-methyltransferase [Candidatus Neomarinimicrobiota bacterium]